MKMLSFLKTVIFSAWFTTLSYANVNEYFQFRPEWQTKLFFDLLKDYHKGVPPTHEGPVTVQLQFRLINFNFIDEANEIAIVRAWVSRRWSDPRLRWNPADYNGTEHMVMETGYIWTPDIELHEGATASETAKTSASVFSSGNVQIVLTYQINFVCSMDLRYFPYDEQECHLKFGSWNYRSDTINLTAPGQDLVSNAFGKTARDFEVVGLTAKPQAVIYDCCPDTKYPYVIYTISLKRISSSYSVKLVLPSALTGFMILATFLLPPRSYEKITLCGIIFMCLLILLTYLHDIVPLSGDTILGEYLAFALFIDFFATVVSVVSYTVHIRSSLTQDQNWNLKEGEGDDHDLKMAGSSKRKKEWLQYVDIVSFGLFSIVFIIGLAVIIGHRP